MEDSLRAQSSEPPPEQSGLKLPLFHTWYIDKEWENLVRTRKLIFVCWIPSIICYSASENQHLIICDLSIRICYLILIFFAIFHSRDTRPSKQFYLWMPIFFAKKEKTVGRQYSENFLRHKNISKICFRACRDQTGIKCVSVAAALRAEQRPRELIKDCISKIREQ